jgi:hypothetical protein
LLLIYIEIDWIYVFELIGKATEPVESRHSFSSDDSRDGKCHMNEEQRQMKFGVQKSKSALNIPMGMYYSCEYVLFLWVCTIPMGMYYSCGYVLFLWVCTIPMGM